MSKPEPCGCMPIVPMLPGVTNVKFCPTHAAAFETEMENVDLRKIRDAYYGVMEQRNNLLAALKEIADWKLPGEPDVYECRRIARAAIAEATSEVTHD